MNDYQFEQLCERTFNQRAGDSVWDEMRLSAQDDWRNDVRILLEATRGTQPDIQKLVAAVGVLEDFIAILESIEKFESDPRLVAKLLRGRLNEALKGGME